VGARRGGPRSPTAVPGADQGLEPVPEWARSLARGRQAYAQQAWKEAYDAWMQADDLAPLEVEDLEGLAVVTYLLGRDDQSIDLLARAHRESLTAGDTAGAARSAFWLAFELLFRGEEARAGGWLSRAKTLLEDGPECAEHGYLLVPRALASLEDDPAAAYALSEQVQGFGQRFEDADLEAIGRLGRGEALIRLGDTAEGACLLDEAMVAVEAGEVGPVIAGMLYCAVIEACHDMFDLRRAQQWTAALHDWCAEQPDLVPYRGQCLVHRSEIMQLHGEWADAMAEVRRAQEWLSDPPGQPAAGMAFYQRGELHRLQLEFVEAEEAYRHAGDRGREPQPGLALLRLAQGKVATAEAMICRAADEAAGDVARARLLGACVEILLAAGHLGAAHEAAQELSEIAARLGAPSLDAGAAAARGVVILAEGDAQGALRSLRQAAAAWSELHAPYECARVRVAIGLACRELGDLDTARMEFEAARRTFVEVGAKLDLVRLDALTERATPRAGGLTPREIEVLRLVAQGSTNREIADTLVISERTVARHMSNILTKLGLSNRAAATAFAYEHDLV
jgi:DNA-binding CsgD family transcriptional regulator